jgi:Na+/H+ antiporter NhaA
MSLFVAGLAFGEGDLLAIAKVGILAASAIAGVVGYGLIRTSPRLPAADAHDAVAAERNATARDQHAV